MEYLSGAKPELTILSFIDALQQIYRMDVVEESLKKFFNHIGKLAVFSSCCDKSGNNDILYLGRSLGWLAPISGYSAGSLSFLCPCGAIQ